METNAATDLELPNAVKYTSFARRPGLDDTGQLLDCVLAAFENTYDDRKNPSSSIPIRQLAAMQQDEKTGFQHSLRRHKQASLLLNHQLDRALGIA